MTFFQPKSRGPAAARLIARAMSSIRVIQAAQAFFRAVSLSGLSVVDGSKCGACVNGDQASARNHPLNAAVPEIVVACGLRRASDPGSPFEECAWHKSRQAPMYFSGDFFVALEESMRTSLAAGRAPWDENQPDKAWAEVFSRADARLKDRFGVLAP